MNCTCQKAMLSADGSMCCRCGGKGIMDLGPVAPGWKREVNLGGMAMAPTSQPMFAPHVPTVTVPNYYQDTGGASGILIDSGPLKTTLAVPDLSEENLRRLIDEWAQSGIKMPLDMPRLSSFLHRKLTGKE